MNMKLAIFLTTLGLLFAPSSAGAQAVSTTVPLGVMTYPLPPETNVIGLPLVGTSIYFGTVSAVTATSISVTDSSAPWIANGLSVPDPHPTSSDEPCGVGDLLPAT